VYLQYYEAPIKPIRQYVYMHETTGTDKPNFDEFYIREILGKKVSKEVFI
jgi:hypothetical protein